MAQLWFIFTEELPQTIWASVSTPPPFLGNAQIYTFFLGGWASLRCVVIHLRQMMPRKVLKFLYQTTPILFVIDQCSVTGSTCKYETLPQTSVQAIVIVDTIVIIVIVVTIVNSLLSCRHHFHLLYGSNLYVEAC